MLMIFTAIIVGLVLLGGLILGVKSKNPPALGLTDNHLRACPESPNCVSSEAKKEDAIHYIQPFPVQGDKAWKRLVAAIESLGGKVLKNDGQYLYATFTSSLFRYVDDVEMRLDGAAIIHVRSASRVGRSDFSANRKRIETLRRILMEPPL
ncbi:MAG: DUF1499 domain-containing protein [Mariprofundaceae bacterium]